MGEFLVFEALFLVVFLENLQFRQVLVSDIGGGFCSLEVVNGVLYFLVLLILVDDWGFTLTVVVGIVFLGNYLGVATVVVVINYSSLFVLPWEGTDKVIGQMISVLLLDMVDALNVYVWYWVNEL